MVNGGVGSSLQGQFSTPQRLDVPHLSEIKSITPQAVSSSTMGSISNSGSINNHQSMYMTNSVLSSSSTNPQQQQQPQQHHHSSSNHHSNLLRQRSSSCGISPTYKSNNFQKDLMGNCSRFGRTAIDTFSGKQLPLGNNLVNYNHHNNLLSNNNFNNQQQQQLQQQQQQQPHHLNNNLNSNFGAIKRLYSKLTVFYSKTRRRFTDTQKAVIWMVFFLVLAFVCAAFLKLFLS